MNIFPDLLRAFVTDVMLILLLATLTRPKYKNKWIYILATTLILTINIGGNVYFYLSKNYSAVVWVDVVMLLFIGVALKPLFSNKVMQWCFSFFTMFNIYIAIVFLSYFFADYLPYPMYANTVLRFLLFGAIILLFRKVLEPLYRKVADNWYIYFLPTLVLCLNFNTYILGGEIREKLSQDALPLMLLVALGATIYITIMHSLHSVTRHYEVREDNLKLQNNQHLLQQAAQSMEKQLTLMGESARQMSIVNHDRKHFNNTLLDLLEQGDINQAVVMLKQQQSFTPNVMKKLHCENPSANAAIGYYSALAQRQNITCNIHATIPLNPVVDSLELSMVLSNLMENAINACSALQETEKRYIDMTVLCEGQLIIEIQNPYRGNVLLDEDNHPASEEKGHGIGTKSILSFVERYQGEIIYSIENNIFNVRLLC